MLAVDTKVSPRFSPSNALQPLNLTPVSNLPMSYRLKAELPEDGVGGTH